MNVSNDNKQAQPRNKKRGPFCFQEKSALHMIHNAECFEENGGSAIAVYTALTWIASDHQRDNFSVSHRHIASRAGVSVSTVKRILPWLDRLGLITIEPRFIDGTQTGNNYRLIRGILPVHNEPTPVQGAYDGEPQLKNRVKKKLKKHSKESTHRTRRNSSNDSVFYESDFSLYSEQEREIIDAYHEILCDNDSNWLRVDKHKLSVCTAIEGQNDPQSCRELFRAAANGGGDVSIPSQKTLVRLLWDNY